MGDKTRNAELVLVLLRKWELPFGQQLQMLGVESIPVADSVKEFAEFAEKISERVDGLLQIHACLRVIFPGDLDLAYSWISTENAAFSKKPLECILVEGQAGIVKVLNYLMRNAQ